MIPHLKIEMWAPGIRHPKEVSSRPKAQRAGAERPPHFAGTGTLSQARQTIPTSIPKCGGASTSR